MDVVVREGVLTARPRSLPHTSLSAAFPATPIGSGLQAHPFLSAFSGYVRRLWAGFRTVKQISKTYSSRISQYSPTYAASTRAKLLSITTSHHDSLVGGKTKQLRELIAGSAADC